MTTPILGAPELVEGQAIPATTTNEMFRFAEQGARWFAFVEETATPPGSPADGDCYLVGASATDAWAGQDGKIAFFMNTAWEFIVPSEGMGGYFRDSDTASVFDGAGWNALASGGSNPTEFIAIACSDEVTAIDTTGTKATLRMPYAFTLSAVRASLTGACTTGTLTVDINEGGASILSTKLTIDATEKTSTTAAVAAVISDTALADDAEITIDVDGAGDSTATGLKVYLIGSRA